MNTECENSAAENPYFPLPCSRTEDLYASAQRRTIKRLLEAWLHRQSLTVTEFLHSADALQKFETAGTSYQHAVQRMAVTLSSRSKASVVTYVKALNGLATDAIRRIYADEKAGLFPALQAEGVQDLAATLTGDPRARYVMHGSLAKHLAGAKSWDEKLAMVLVLRGACSGEKPGAALVAQATDDLAGEILEDATVLKRLLGAEQPLHENLSLAVRLFRARQGDEFGDIADSLKRLAESLSRNEFANARSALARYVFEMVASGAPLTNESLFGELTALRKLIDLIKPNYGPYFDAGEFDEAFASRSKRFVTQEALFKLTEDCKSPDERLDRILDLEGKLEGAANKRALAPFALAFLAVHNFEQDCAAGAPGAQRLKRLADLQRRILASSFPDGPRDKMTGILDAMAVRVEAEGRLFAGLERRFSDPAERVGMILKLLENGIFTEGAMTSKARRAILAGVAQPGFLETYTAPRGKDKQAVLMELVTQLKRLGISPEESVRAMSVN